MELNKNTRIQLLILLQHDQIAFQQAISDGKTFSEVKPLYFNMKKIYRHLAQWKDSASWVDADDVDYSEEYENDPQHMVH